MAAAKDDYYSRGSKELATESLLTMQRLEAVSRNPIRFLRLFDSWKPHLRFFVPSCSPSILNVLYDMIRDAN
jgi:hypothetical protein